MLSNSFCDHIENDVAKLLSPIVSELKSIDLGTMIAMSKRDNLSGFKTLIRDVSEAYLAPGYISVYSIPTSPDPWTNPLELKIPMRLDLSNVTIYVDVSLLAHFAYVRVVHAEPRQRNADICPDALRDQVIEEIARTRLWTPGDLLSDFQPATEPHLQGGV